jgi:hypothetical protein
MFEAITFSTQNKLDTKNPIDIGALVECMLFYEKTTVIANQVILAQLIRYFGVVRLLLLIQEDLLNIVYTESGVGIFTSTVNGTEYHSTTEFSSPQHKYQDELRKICISVAGKDGKGRRLAQRIQDKIHVTQHDQIILEGANKSILDQNYVGSAARIVIKELVPEFDDISPFSFHTDKTNNGIVIETNIDFVILNELYHRRVPPEHSSITPALILAHLLDAEAELYFASANLSELASSNLSAKLAEQKIDYVIARSARSSEALTHFTSFIFKDAKAIREAVNSNRIDLDELISVLQKSKQFKKWVTSVSPDTNLIKAYYEEVTKGTVADKLPTKSVRWTVFTGLGIAADAIATGGFGTVASIVIGALDTFYIDKLIAGWKPNQFIEEDVKKLIGKDT